MRRCLALAALALAAAAARADDGEPREVVGPLLVIHKDTPAQVPVGADVPVTVTATNYGTGPAFDVELRDGDTVEKAASLDHMETLRFSYSVAAKRVGKLRLPMAKATFAASSDAGAERLVASSNEAAEHHRDERRHSMDYAPRGVEVMSAEAYDRISTRYIRETLMLAVLAAALVGFPLAIGRQKQLQADMHVRDSRRKL